MVKNLLDNVDLKQPKGLGAAKHTANQLTVVELVRSLTEIDPRKRVVAFRLLEKHKAIRVFEQLHPDEQANLIRAMEDPEILPILEAMPAEQRVRLFEELPAKVTQRLLSQLSSGSRETVDMLLGYPEGSAGRRMRLRYLTVPNNVTVASAMRAVQESILEDSDLEMIFLTDNQGFYRGLLRTVRLMRADMMTPVDRLTNGVEVAVSVSDSEMKAAKLLKDYDLPAVPVLDGDGRLVGDITFDDVIDLVEEEASEAALSQAGVGTLLSRDKGWSERLVRGPAGYAVRLRLLFLIVTLVGGFVVGGVIDQFEETLEAVVAAAVFIPLVMDMGGNVGTQSSTIFARGLAWSQIDVRQFLPYFLREVKIGATMGLVLGLAAGVIAYYWQGAPNGIPQIGLAVGVSLFAVITLGAILGSAMPWVMLKLGFDHGPGADPFITTIKDFVGLLIYFALVNALVGVNL
jgi:magnesium transporter